ncbi:MAG: alpha/beta fold hydrolase [Cupriavidus sp.]|nr:MAG: alpha/beta fold hydrolase [Cupriavidus sp.]
MAADPSLRLHRAGTPGAPALVLGNSLGTDRRLWHATVQAFANDYEVIRFDAPGHGGQDAFAFGSLRELATRLAGALADAGIDTFRYCGVSMGAAIGMELALTHGPRVSALVLANTAPQFGPAAFWQGRIDQVRAGGTGAIAEATVSRWLTPAHAARDPALRQWLVDMFGTTTAAGYVACAQAVMAFDGRDALRHIGVPTLVMAGTEDLATPPAQGRALHAAIAGSQYLALPAAHLAPLGAPDAFHRAVRDFLQATRANP